MLSKRVPPVPPRAGTIAFLIFSEGGLGGMPRGGGKGGTLLRTLVFKLRYSRTIHFFIHDNFSARYGPLAAYTKRVLTATIGPPAETGRPQSVVLLRSRCTKRLGWLCLHYSLLCQDKGHRASFLVNAKSLRTNERMELNEVQRNEWMRELSFCYLSGRSVFGTRRM